MKIMKSVKISEMRNLGPASEKMLAKIGINTSQQLIKLGPEKAFKIMKEKGMKPHTSFLYAMIGAVTDRSWFYVVKDFKQADMLKSQNSVQQKNKKKY